MRMVYLISSSSTCAEVVSESKYSKILVSNMSEDRITHQQPSLLLTWGSVERDANVMSRWKVWRDHVFGPVTTELYSFTSSTLLLLIHQNE